MLVPKALYINLLSSLICMLQQVTWLEHVEIEDRTPIHRLFGDLIQSGVAFAAERWLATLQRMCERIACQMVSSTSTRDLGGGNVNTVVTDGTVYAILILTKQFLHFLQLFHHLRAREA